MTTQLPQPPIAPSPRPLGDLGKLPLEIRGKVYAQVLCSLFWEIKEQGLWQPFLDRHSVEDVAVDVSLLRVSKAIHLEALDTLYREVVFDTDIFKYMVRQNLEQSGQRQMEKMRNIDFRVGLFSCKYDGCGFYDSEAKFLAELKRTLDCLFHPFSDHEKRRNQFRLHIKSDALDFFDENAIYFITRMLSSYLEGLQGFQSVIFEAEFSPVFGAQRGPGSISSHLDGIMETLRPNLERTLGPSERKEVITSDSNDACAIEFTPRIYLDRMAAHAQEACNTTASSCRKTATKDTYYSDTDSIAATKGMPPINYGSLGSLTPSRSPETPAGSLGVLEQLPREVRDIIYELLLCNKYSLIPKYRGKTPAQDETDRAILRTSKIIYTEAKEVLYTRSLFSIRLGENEAMQRALLVARGPRDYGQMRNLKIFCEVTFSRGAGLIGHEGRSSDPGLVEHIIARLCHTYLSQFLGSEIERDTCTVEVPFGGRGSSRNTVVHDLLRLFAAALAGLRGFHRVIIQTSYCRDLPGPECKIGKLHANAALDIFRGTLEPSLGPASVTIRSCNEVETDEAERILEFHPLDFAARKGQKAPPAAADP